MPDRAFRYLATATLQRLVADHTPDESGRCAGCRSSDTPQPWWPCGPRTFAEQELNLRREPTE